jgi:hypothetical protein
VAILELHSERMFRQRHAGVLFVSLQGRLEKGPKMSRSRLVTHITSKEEMWGEERELVRCEEMIARKRDVVW